MRTQRFAFKQSRFYTTRPPLLAGIFLGILSLLKPSLGRAQPSEPAPDQTLSVEREITVTADRVPLPLAEVGNSVTVVTADEIAESGARWIGDVLERVPGVTVARTGGPGEVTSAFLRGTNSNHVLVLLDGIKINSPSTGGYDFAHLPAALIDRVEVVRGPQSSVYGSEALGGVINVITRRGSGPVSGSLALDGGSFGTARTQGSVAGLQGAWDYAGSLAYSHSNGFSAADKARGNAEADGYRNLSADASLGHRVGKSGSVQGFVRAFDARTEIDDFAFGVGPVDDTNSVVKTRSAYVGARLNLTKGSWDTSLALGDTEQSLRSDNPDASFTLGSRLTTSIRQVNWQNRVALGSKNAIITGAEYRRESADSTSHTTFGDSGFDKAIDVVGLYLHDHVTSGAFSGDVGGRYEHHSLFGDKVTYRATASVRTDAGLRLHGSVGSAFRGPSLNDLYYPGFNNADLKPESSTGVDAGIEGRWRRPDLRFDVTFFHNDIENLIQFSPATSRPENIGKVGTKGVELSASWSPVKSVSLGGEYTFTRAVDKATDLQLLRRPRQQGSLRASVHPKDGLRLHTEVVAKGERADFGTSGRTVLPSFAIWNAALELEVRRGFWLTGRLDNLLDKTFEDVFGYGTARRSGYAGVEYRFGGSR